MGETITGCHCHHGEPGGKGKGKDGCDRHCCLQEKRVVPKCAVAKWTACESDRPKQGEPGDQLGQMPRQRCQVKKSIRCMAICKFVDWNYGDRKAKVRDCNKKLCEKTGPVVCSKTAMMM